MYGIPNMKLDKELVVQRRVDLLAAEGIKFVKTGCDIGKDLWTAGKAPRDVRRRRLLHRCNQARRDLPIPGRDCSRASTSRWIFSRPTPAPPRYLDDGSLPSINAKGKDVVVIGGGDTGTDCVGDLLRHGCAA
jgi:glutamate synthase (NADPH) small chain